MKNTKKILLLLISSIVLLAFVACGGNNEEQVKNDTNSVGEKNNAKHVLVNELEFVGAEVAEPDSIGTRYFKSQIKNNSKYKITSINIEYELNNGETSFFSINDTILPGETSSIAQCFGSTTGKVEDMKAKKYNITMISDDNKTIYITYDVKLDKYSVMEGSVIEEVTPPVLVTDIEFVNSTILPPDSIGTIYFETQIKNNSKSTITAVSVEIELDNGETAYLSTYDTLLPGETGTKATCFGPTTGKQEDMKAKKISITALDENQKEIFIDYDVKLKKYEVTKVSS